MNRIAEVCGILAFAGAILMLIVGLVGILTWVHVYLISNNAWLALIPTVILDLFIISIVGGVWADNPNLLKDKK